MKRFFLLILLFTFLGVLLHAEKNWSLYGTNEFELIYRNMTSDYQDAYGDEHKINIQNSIQLQFMLKQIQAGLKFNAYHPKYEQFASDPITIHDEEEEYYFEEYYLQYESDFNLARLGTFDAVIGSGMTLHNYYDTDFDEDTSLRGLYLSRNCNFWSAKLFYGFMENESEAYQDENEFDQVGAFDFEIPLWKSFSFGGAYVLQRINQSLENDTEEDFLQRNVIHSRMRLQFEKIELVSEFAHSNDDDDLKGNAFYSNLTSYLGVFTVTGAYKNYEHFNTPISDLPTVNHSEEPLLDSYEPGTDEEGIMGELRFIPNYENQVILNYAEGWNSDQSIRQSDFYGEYKREFDTFSITTDYEHLEQWEEDTSWHKEATPHVEFDYFAGNFPITFKMEYQLKEEANISEEKSHEEPKMQIDIGYLDYSISAIAETQIGDSFEAEDGDWWLGVEFAAYLFGNTDIRLFLGKEKAGKVCRNGVCKFQPEFEGARLKITTTF